MAPRHARTPPPHPSGPMGKIVARVGLYPWRRFSVTCARGLFLLILLPILTMAALVRSLKFGDSFSRACPLYWGPIYSGNIHCSTEQSAIAYVEVDQLFERWGIRNIRWNIDIILQVSLLHIGATLRKFSLTLTLFRRLMYLFENALSPRKHRIPISIYYLTSKVIATATVAK